MPIKPRVVFVKLLVLCCEKDGSMWKYLFVLLEMWEMLKCVWNMEKCVKPRVWYGEMCECEIGW